ncbi:MAG: AAA-like domain-containing protein [Proteobacteria bacterium]|nr:AAA-like domain-containing protein [Pseudomonadota bacterium]
MNEKPENNSSAALDKTGEFFSVGPPLHAVKPGYVRRAADDFLYQTLVAGNYAHVIAPDRTGKSSLIAATSARLQNNGFKVAVLDLSQIGERDGASDAGRWYYSIAYRLLRQLRLKVDLQTWWQDNSILSNRQRLVEFFADVILQNIQERIVVFVDEIQYVADLPFDEHLLASIRAAHNARGTEPEFSRLSFAMIGECDPHSLALGPAMSPFLISQEIKLSDFSREDLNIFAAELELSVADAGLALDRIFEWTSGQPYLSQKLARSVAREQISGDIKGHVDRIVMHQLAGRGATRNEPHLSHLHRLVVDDKKNYEPLLNLYGRIRKGIRVAHDSQSKIQRRLMATGLVVANDSGDLAVRNKVYETVFTARWANENLPLHWRGPAIAAVVIMLVTAIPFAYTQLLPKPYMRVMSTPTFDLETISDAYVNLRSFPGHADAADRMFQLILEDRARQAADRNTILNVSRFARLLPESTELADGFLADYWDRQVGAAMRDGRRDDALLASLESLVVSTPARRRRASTLVGDDYSHLLATNPVQEADGLAFDAEKMQLTYFTGAQISQWSLVDQSLEAREPWTMSALEVTPLVRRVVIVRGGLANRVGLTVNVSHARLDDIRMKLIAPSGRTVELAFDQLASSANDEIRISREQLSPLIGEPLNGTWSLSLRDESTGVSGHLVGWNLSLNSQVVVENFERGLDIPDPVEIASENLWFSPDGRYAIARALQSDSARLWNLNSAEAARTIAVPANEQVLGLSANAEYLVTTTQDTINMWRTASGRRSAVLDVGAAGTDAILGADGEHLLVPRRSDIDTLFQLWSLSSGRVVAELSVAGAPALVAMDATGKHLAVADYDRAVRIWDISAGELVSQIDLASQPSQIELSANGESLGVVHGDEGVSLWRTDRPKAPVLQESSRDEWQIAFSQSGARFLAGNVRQGFQAYRSSDGAISGPLLDAGVEAGGQKLLAFSADEKMIVTAARNGIARFWAAPPTAAAVTNSASADIMPGHQLWSASGDTITVISPGGERIAIGDSSGHVHVLQIDAGAREIGAEREEISFLGHRGPVVAMVFNNDASLVASAGADGTVRIWDGSSGLPRPFYGSASASTVGRMAFSPSSAQLAILSGQRTWIMDVETGAVLADIELGELHAGLTFAADGQLYLGGESGALRSLYADRTGNWHLRNVWQGSDAIRQIEFSAIRQQIVIVDGRNEARLLDISSGRIGSTVLQLPDTVTEIAFSRSEARVLFKTGLWIHQALVSPAGLVWADAIRAPKSLSGSRMAFDRQAIADKEALHGDYENDRVLVLTRDTGFAKIAEIHFDYDAGPALFGNRGNLIAEWTQKVRGETPIGFVREGF